MEDLYLRFERENSNIELRIRNEYEEKLKNEKEKFKQMMCIYGQVNSMQTLDNMTESQMNIIPSMNQDSSIEYAKAQIVVTNAHRKNHELTLEVSKLWKEIQQKENIITELKSDILGKIEQ